MVWPIIARIVIVKGGQWVLKKALKNEAKKQIKKQAKKQIKEQAKKGKNAAQKAKEQFQKKKKGCTQGCGQKGSAVCKVLAAEIYSRAGVLGTRVKDLLEDKLGLFTKAYDKPSPSLPKGSGSFKGHIHQAQGVQRGLQRKITEYDAAKCSSPKIQPVIRKMAYTPIPTAPST